MADTWRLCYKNYEQLKNKCKQRNQLQTQHHIEATAAGVRVGCYSNLSVGAELWLMVIESS